MKAVITATAPTHYQSKSLGLFKLDKLNKNPYSSEMVGYSEFNTVAEARNYLKKLAFNYYENDKEIKWNSGKDYLDLDACTGRIITGWERIGFLTHPNRKY